MKTLAKQTSFISNIARLLPHLATSTLSEAKALAKRAYFLANAVRLLPHLALFRYGPNRSLTETDLDRWRDLVLRSEPGLSRAGVFLRLMIRHPEYRNLFYHRAGPLHRPLKFLCPPMSTLYLPVSKIGPGLFIQHGFSTIVWAREIGANCWINQQVTIGSSAVGCPVVGDNVTIHAGAKVLGDITIGDGAIIGANAVVVKSVPPNATVVGVPAYIVKRDGRKVRESL